MKLIIHFKNANNLNDSSALLTPQQIENLNKQIIILKNEYNQFKAELKQLKKSPSSEMSMNISSVNGTLVKTLNLEKITLETSISELSSRYGPKHPLMIEKRDELNEINKRIKQQASSVKTILKQDLQLKVNLAKEKLNALEKEKEIATGENIKNNSVLITLRELNREVQASQNTLQSFLEEYNKSVDKDLTLDSDVKIISFANVPVKPSTPDKRLIFALGILTTLMGSFFAVLLRNKFYSKFRDAEDLEDKFGYTCLAKIPFTRSGWNKDLINQTLSNPTSAITETFRDLRLALKTQISKKGDAPKIISMMSSVDNEGKTTTAVLLASLAAKAGERVVLMDANLHNPTIHKMLGKKNDNSLVDFLTDQKPLNDVLHKDKDTGLNVIFGSAVPNNAFNLLSLSKLDILMEALRQNYDLVIIDTPASLEASDARLIEQLADFSLYNVKYNATRDKAVAKGVKPYLSQGNKALAFILTHAKS